MLIENTETFSVSSIWDIISHLIYKSFNKFILFSDGIGRDFKSFSQKYCPQRIMGRKLPNEVFFGIEITNGKESQFFPENQNLKKKLRFLKKIPKSLLTPQE